MTGQNATHKNALVWGMPQAPKRAIGAIFSRKWERAVLNRIGQLAWYDPIISCNADFLVVLLIVTGSP